jgi:glycosyltransferase involved in cell wall biosynthesis
VRILHIFRAPVGGLFRHVVDLAYEQAARGHDVGLFCDSIANDARTQPMLDRLAPHLKLGITRVPMHRNPHLTDWQVWRELQAHLTTLSNLDVLHGHGSKGGLYARLAKSSALRAYTPHGGSFNYQPGTLTHWLYMQVERALKNRTDLYLFESAFIETRVREEIGAPLKSSSVVHNGIHDNEFTPIVHSADAADFVFLGELRHAKGIGLLLEALARLNAQNKKPHTLLIVGSGPDEAVLKARTAELNLTPYITFESAQPIRDVLARGRIMVIPSRFESLPYVILEAAAAGQPLIATHVGGIPEIFGRETHRLVAPNSIEALHKAMAVMLATPDSERIAQAQRLADSMRKTFSVSRMAETILTRYSEAQKTNHRFAS